MEVLDSVHYLLHIPSRFCYDFEFLTTGKFVLHLTMPKTMLTVSQIVGRLGYSVVKTNLWTVAANAVGFVVLLATAKSSDYFRERTFHIVFALCVSLLGMIILASVDTVANKGVAYFSCFLMAAGAYTPSVLVHSWHNNNNLEENSRAATTGLLVGLGNLGGILSAATFRVEYAPAYRPTLIATSCCNAVCIFFTLGLGIWMKMENRRKNREQGTVIKAEDVHTSDLPDGEQSEHWRFFT